MSQTNIDPSRQQPYGSTRPMTDFAVKPSNDLELFHQIEREHSLPEPCQPSTCFGILHDHRGTTYWMSGRQVTQQFWEQCREAEVVPNNLHEHDTGGAA